jgi:hypothetical protein
MSATLKVKRCTAIDEARVIIDKNVRGVPFNSDDLKRLSDITGTEIYFAVKRKNPFFPGDLRHLHVIAYDWDEPTEWSWRQAIEIFRDRDPQEALEMRQHQRVWRALRFSIKGVMREFVLSADVCAVCGDFEDLTCDHTNPPFITIAEEYLSTYGAPELVDCPGAGKVIKDLDIEAAWIQFHGQRASYQALCRSCNSAKGVRAK